MSHSRIKPIITIEDTANLPKLLQACDEVTLEDLKDDALVTTVQELQATLIGKIPGVANNTHLTPAYLAANQIGNNKRVVLLYLPKEGAFAEQIVMFNPIYTVKEAAGNPSHYRISTFFAEQFRFRNDFYARKIEVEYGNQDGKRVSLLLDNHAAIAAQMGINFVYGITPLDYNIDTSDLLNFIDHHAEEKLSGSEKIITTRQAYILQSRAVNNDYQFGSNQIDSIKNFTKQRMSMPVLFNPNTGFLLAREKQMLHHHWNSFAQLKIGDPERLQNQTGAFFQTIPLQLRFEFTCSTRQIIHFGISTGAYHTDQQKRNEANGLPYDKKIIGYDLSENAINHITSKGMQGRVVDLNQIDDSDKNKLSYHDILSNDLSSVSDILVIRTLECLNPKALQLFLFSLIALAKPGSKIYLEIFGSDNKDAVIPRTHISFNYFVKPRLVTSFFAPRTDMKFIHSTIVENGINDRSSGFDYTVVERLIVEKLPVAGCKR